MIYGVWVLNKILSDNLANPQVRSRLGKILVLKGSERCDRTADGSNDDLGINSDYNSDSSVEGTLNNRFYNNNIVENRSEYAQKIIVQTVMHLQLEDMDRTSVNLQKPALLIPVILVRDL